MTPWYESAAPVRRIERDLPGHRLRVVGETIQTATSAHTTGWTPELAPEFSEADRARREGYEAGQRDATERMGDLERQRLHALATAVGDTARSINAERKAAVNVAENDVLELALQLAEAIIGSSSCPRRRGATRSVVRCSSPLRRRRSGCGCTRTTPRPRRRTRS
jgi:hypothetical protein